MSISDLRKGVTYGNAQVRGQLRQWKAKLARNYATASSTCDWLGASRAGRDLLSDMIRGARTTRRRAFDVIHKKLGPGVTLEKYSLDGRGSRSGALWSILKPRASVTAVEHLSADYTTRERLSLDQDCVTVNAIAVFGDNDRCAYSGEGLWTLEVPDHALGRAVERSGLLQPETIIRDAHRNLLALPRSTLRDHAEFTDRYGGTILKAGGGGFICYAAMMKNPTDPAAELDLAVKVHTWVDEDLLGADQVIMSEKGKPGDTLGDSWFLPPPFKTITRDEQKGYHVQTKPTPWSEGE